MMYPIQLNANNAGRVAGSASALPLSLFHLARLLQAGVSLSDAFRTLFYKNPSAV